MNINFENLDLKSIKYFSEPTIYQRGYEYYKKGYVKKLEYISNDKIVTARVLGTYSSSYRVKILEIKNKIEASCNCPYDGYPCKHIVAVLLEFYNNKDIYIKNELKKIEKEEKSIKSITEVLNNLNKEDLQKIILDLYKKSKEVKKELPVLLNKN